MQSDSHIKKLSKLLKAKTVNFIQLWLTLSGMMSSFLF